jgi:hypothetical protein
VDYDQNGNQIVHTTVISQGPDGSQRQVEQRQVINSQGQRLAPMMPGEGLDNLFGGFQPFAAPFDPMERILRMTAAQNLTTRNPTAKEAIEKLEKVNLTKEDN